eukprot:COSAG05_NODE_1363_length_5081_cov_1.577479_8_plen_77_part_00
MLALSLITPERSRGGQGGHGHVFAGGGAAGGGGGGGGGGRVRGGGRWRAAVDRVHVLSAGTAHTREVADVKYQQHI